MSKPAAHYDVRTKPALSRAQLLRRDCCRSCSDGRYRPPTGHEIDSLIELSGWTQNEVADMIGVTSSNKGISTIRRWKCNPDADSYRAMPYSAWRLMLIESGLIEPTSISAS